MTAPKADEDSDLERVGAIDAEVSFGIVLVRFSNEHGDPAPFVQIPDEGAKNEFRARKVMLNSEVVSCAR